MYGQLDRCPICRSVRSERPARGNTGSAADRFQGVRFLRCVSVVRYRIRYEVRYTSDTGFYNLAHLVTKYTLTNLKKSTRNRGRDRGRPRQRPPSVEPPWPGGSVRVPSFPESKSLTPDATRLVQRFRSATLADLASKRPATLRCARTAVRGPSAAGRATSERSERKRQAVRCGRRRGRSSVVDRHWAGNPLQYPASTPGFPPYFGCSREVSQLSRRFGGEPYVC